MSASHFCDLSSIEMNLPFYRRQSQYAYTPLWLNKASLTQRFGVKRLVLFPVVILILILLICAHKYWTITYPAQLIPSAEYYPTLIGAIAASFPEFMHDSLKNALESHTSRGDESIPNRVFQTDRLPPPKEFSETWDKHGFERIFLNDSQALDWVSDHFGDSEVTRTYRALPKPILYAYVYFTSELHTNANVGSWASEKLTCCGIWSC
jgi:hypothetical protein